MANKTGETYNSTSPKSLYQTLLKDNPELANKAFAARAKYDGDCYAMDQWAKAGFVSKGISHDVTLGDERQDDEDE